jgi:small subunit ribosomal protein S18
MAKPTDRKRTKETRTRGGKKKVCAFCKERAERVDYKDVANLRRFMSERGKIRSRRVTGNCAQHQRDVQVAIKTARELALLPYLQRTASDRGLGRARTAAGSETEYESATEEAATTSYDEAPSAGYHEAPAEPEFAEGP